MIHEVDGALRGLLRQEALQGTDVEVVLDAPTRDWAARRSAPTLNVYLYDIREDVRRRELGHVEEVRDQQVVARYAVPRHFRLSYLVSAWTQRPEDEHRLLSSVLACLLRYEAMPPDLLTVAFLGQRLPVSLSVALPPSEDRSFADVWQALGGELKPSLDVVATVPVDVGLVFPVSRPPDQPPIVQMSNTDGTGDEQRRPRPVDASTRARYRGRGAR